MALSNLNMQIENSHVYSYSRDSTTATFVMIGAFSDRFTLKEDLLNSRYSDLSYVVNSNITSDQTQNLTCTAVNLTPIGVGDSGTPVKCKFNATFTAPGTSSVSASSDDIDQSFGKVENWNVNGQYAGEALTLNQVSWKWDDDVAITAEDGLNAVKIIPHLELVYNGEWNSITNGITAINNCIGKVNKTTYLNVPSDRLMLTGASFSQNAAPSGAKWAITFNFGVMPLGWNKFYRQKDGKFKKIVNSSTGSDVFSNTDYSQLDPENW